jgi:small-conductance mechanosensitive channel/CRP-like cAMP-binding protein
MDLLGNPITYDTLLVLVGLISTAVLWPLRRQRIGRRTIVSVWLALLASGVHAFTETLPLPAPGPDGSALSASPLQNMVTAVWLMLWVNVGIQVLDLLLWEFLLVRRHKTPPISRLVVDITNVVVLVVAGLVVLSYVFAQDLTALLVTSTVVSAVIGLSLQDVLRNVVAGIALQIEAPFSLGDWVKVAGFEGQVMQMNWRTVTLRTRENNHVLITNGKIASEDIVNWNRPVQLQGIDAYVGVAYPHAPGEVKTVLAQAVAGAAGVQVDPGPQVYTEEYGDFAINYRIRYWITDYEDLREIQDAVMTRVWYALRRAGMTIPFPIRDVNLRTVPEDAATRAEATRRRVVVETLQPIDVFSPLSHAQLAEVAEHADLRRYTAGEALMRQGDPGDSLYVVHAGRVRIDVTDAAGRTVTVASRGPGEVFGEMSLLTGAPRNASVIAETETEVVTVGKAAFADILLADPAIAERISAQLTVRADETGARLAEADAEAVTGKGRRDEMVGRIRSFFGLGEARGDSRGQDAGGA